jgi:hypothetical protein
MVWGFFFCLWMSSELNRDQYFSQLNNIKLLLLKKYIAVFLNLAVAATIRAIETSVCNIKLQKKPFFFFFFFFFERVYFQVVNDFRVPSFARFFFPSTLLLLSYFFSRELYSSYAA